MVEAKNQVRHSQYVVVTIIERVHIWLYKILDKVNERLVENESYYKKTCLEIDVN